MNKHVQSLVLRIWLAVFAVLVVLPAVDVGAQRGSPPSDTNYIAIKLKKYTRDKPVVKTNVDCNPGDIVPDTGCIEIVSGTGVYNFVGAFSTFDGANIGDLTVADLSTDYPGGSGSTTVDGTSYFVVDNTIRVYGLTVGRTYSFYFNFYDARSADIVSLLGDTKTECDDHPLPVGAGVVNDTGHSTTNAKAQQIRQISQPDFGCQIYDEAPFLPKAITVSVNRDGKGYEYTRKGMTLSDTVDINAAATAAEDDSTTGGGKTTDANACSDSWISWLACPLSVSLANFVQSIGSKIGSLLFTGTDAIFTDEMRTSWNVFRNVGLALILIAGLVMVISQAMGLDILDAYTIRKLMPRLAIAVIGIALSWPLMQVAITLVNDIGLIAYDAIVYPFRNMLGLDGVSGAKQLFIFGSASGAGLIIALFAGLDIVGVILFMFTIVLAVLIGLVVLGIRQIVIIMGILMAPLAIAAYVLPGTQKLWSFWKGTMITTLAMFPIIMAFLAAGDAASRVALAAGQNTLLALLLFFAPYFMLPFAFKLAGGLMTTIFSIANDRNRGLFDRLSKARQNRAADMRNRIKEDRRWQADNKAARFLSRNAQSAYILGSGRAGVSPRKLSGRLAAERSSLGTHDARKAMENEAVQAALSDDYMIDAALHGKRTHADALQYFRDKGDDEKTAQMRAGMIENAKKAVGQEAFFEAAVAANAGTKTGFAGGRHQLNEKINAIAGKDDVKRARMMASAREQAKAAGRVDLYGGSYGDSVDIAKLQQEDLDDSQRQAIIDRVVKDNPDSILATLKPGERITEEKVNELAGMSVLRNNSVWEVGGGYYIGTQNMKGAMLAELETAQNNYRAVVEAAGPQPTEAQQADIKKAQEEYVRVIARDSALTQIAGQTNGKNADIIGAIQGQNFISPTATYADLTNPANFQKKIDEKGEVVKNEKGEEVIVPITTLRDATLHAEMGVASYHNYVQSYYAQQVMGPALQQQQGKKPSEMTPEERAQWAAQESFARGIGGNVPPGAQPPPGFGN